MRFSVPIEPFSIHIEASVLSDLRTRIRNTRWPGRPPAAAWEQGMDLDYLAQVHAYWADEFDWRAQGTGAEQLRSLSRLPRWSRNPFRARTSPGHERYPADPHPWLAKHIVEYLAVIPLLTDPAGNGIDGPAFDVVIPSLPGYGFSERPARTGVNYRYIAGLWHSPAQGRSPAPAESSS
jgi:hypothetical protein